MNSKRKTGSTDKELAAIGAILSALDGLDGESIQRVLDYVFGRLSIARSSLASPVPTTNFGMVSPPVSEFRHSKSQISVRDLKDEKQPESANQMAALVAYYLSDVAPENERKDSINSADLEKYFKQAGFKLPNKIPQTLPNAAAAGYFDATGNGLYHLNPVGYNLVVHGLPRSHAPSGPSRSRPVKKKSVRH